jgi:hypothetical protein
VLGSAQPTGFTPSAAGGAAAASFGGIPDVRNSSTNPFAAGTVVQLSNILLQYNGSTYPGEGGYQVNQYQNALNYETYLQLTNNIRNNEDGPGLTFNTFNNVYGYYVFDLRFHDWNEGGNVNPQMTLTMNFSNPVLATNPMNIFATIISQSALNLTLGSGKMSVALA